MKKHRKAYVKAWFVFTRFEDRGYMVHARSGGQAKKIVFTRADLFIDLDWCDLRVRRCRTLDDRPITAQTMIKAGFDMTFEGEPIREIDVPCACPICSHLEIDDTGLLCLKCGGMVYNDPDGFITCDCYQIGRYETEIGYHEYPDFWFIERPVPAGAA